MKNKKNDTVKTNKQTNKQTKNSNYWELLNFRKWNLISYLPYGMIEKPYLNLKKCRKLFPVIFIIQLTMKLNHN
jgi:hypothetical protein